jgi:hypothetical protein
MRHALGITRDEDLSKVHVQHFGSTGSRGLMVDFNQGRSPTDLEHDVFALIASIASIKDHLKLWCRQNGKGFNGEKLIDSNIDVAIVHDLWNTDKHATLNKPPRSGKRPSLTDLKQSLRVSTGTTSGSFSGVRLDPHTGKLEPFSSDGGLHRLVVDA